MLEDIREIHIIHENYIEAFKRGWIYAMRLLDRNSMRRCGSTLN
jgi:hypothetical protein